MTKKSGIMPYINGLPFQFALRAGTEKLWLRSNYGLTKPAFSRVVIEYAYPCKKSPEDGERGPYALFPKAAKVGFELVDVVWKEIETQRFAAKMVELYTDHNGNIVCLFQRTDDETIAYTMTSRDFRALMKAATMVNGVFVEDWTFARRGNSYSLRPTWM